MAVNTVKNNDFGHICRIGVGLRFRPDNFNGAAEQDSGNHFICAINDITTGFCCFYPAEKIGLCFKLGPVAAGKYFPESKHAGNRQTAFGTVVNILLRILLCCIAQLWRQIRPGDRSGDIIATNGHEYPSVFSKKQNQLCCCLAGFVAPAIIQPDNFCYPGCFFRLRGKGVIPSRMYVVRSSGYSKHIAGNNCRASGIRHSVTKCTWQRNTTFRAIIKPLLGIHRGCAFQFKFIAHGFYCGLCQQ